MNDIFDEYLDDAITDETEEDINLDLESIKNSIPTFTSDKLCEMIVCDRYLGISQESAIMCMEELAKRRLSGDSFDFETTIESLQKDLPVLDFSMPDLRMMLGQIINKK